MKRSITPLSTLSVATLLAATLFLARTCPAAGDSYRDRQDAVVPGADGLTVVDPVEEAHKIRRLVKFALANNASDASRSTLDEEIKTIEHDKKLKKNIVTSLLQDDDSDPTLPKVVLVKYPDGSIRGILFIQTDGVRNNKPNQLAWPLDPKRESKEASR